MSTIIRMVNKVIATYAPDGVGPKTMWHNFATEFGGVPNGVTPTSAWGSFRTWARTQNDTVYLYIPPGTYTWDTSDVANAGNAPFDGIKLLTVSAYGVTFPPDIWLSCVGGGFSQYASTSARVNAVTAGDTTLTLVTPAETSFFSAGRWCALAACEMQGTGGYPPNQYYVEFCQIESIGIGTITVSTPIGGNYRTDFKSTSVGAYDTGGPATLFLMDPPQNGTGGLATGWDTETKILGLTIDNSSLLNPQMVMSGRSIIICDMNFIDCAPIPTANKSFIAQGCTNTNEQVEVDKSCEYVEFIGSDLYSMLVQSASVQQLVIDHCSLAVNLNGTAKSTIIRNNCIIPSLTIGSVGYGGSVSLSVSDSVVNSVSYVLSDTAAYTAFTNSGGVLNYFSGSILNWANPDGRLFLSGASRTFCSLLSATHNVSVDGSNNTTLITSFPDPLPTLPVEVGAPSYIRQHPCPSVTFTNVTGCDQVVELSNAPPSSPVGSYFQRTGNFDPAVSLTPFWGSNTSISINVTRAYTGAQPNAFISLFAEYVSSDSTTWGQYGPHVDAKVVGERIITAASLSGIQPSDNVGSPTGGNIFIEGCQLLLVDTNNGFNPLDMSGDTDPEKPIITITIQLNQS